MLAAAALLGWAALLALAGPVMLRRAAWPTRSPRLGLLAWQAASASFVAALVLGGLALAVPATVLSGGLADLLTNCVMAIRDAYRSPAGASAAGAGLVLAAAVTLRVTSCVCAGLRDAARRRGEHAAALRVVGRRNDTLDALVVDHDTPRAYCLPGRAPTIVLTTGTLQRLVPDELAAVLAHERAHIRARHHLVIAAAAGLSRALPRVPLLRIAADAIPALAEMAADDIASRKTNRAQVATALVALAAATTPAAALSVAGPGAVARVQRLLRPASPISLPATGAAVVLAAAVFAAPAVAALAPAWVAGPMADCPMPMSQTDQAMAQNGPMASG